MKKSFKFINFTGIKTKRKYFEEIKPFQYFNVLV